MGFQQTALDWTRDNIINQIHSDNQIDPDKHCFYLSHKKLDFNILKYQSTKTTEGKKHAVSSE